MAEQALTKATQGLPVHSSTVSFSTQAATENTKNKRTSNMNCSTHNYNNGNNVTSQRHRRPRVRLQKSRLLDVESNLRLLMLKGLVARKSDAAILATAPRELLRPITMELYKSLSSFEKAEFRRGCRKMVDGKVKIDKNKLCKVIKHKEKLRLDRLQDFVFSRRQQREDVAVETAALATDPSVPGHLLRLGSIANKRAKLALDGKMKAFSYVAKVEGLEDDLRRKRKRSSDAIIYSGDEAPETYALHKPKGGLPEQMPVIVMPQVIREVINNTKAEENIKTVISELKPTYTFFLERCKLLIGDKKKATIKRRCENEGFLVDIDGKICALHITQLFTKLEDFAQPLEWFADKQELNVFIRDVLELEHCPFLSRVKGLSGNLIASATLVPPDQWIIKVPPGMFTVYTCPPSSAQSTTDRIELVAAPAIIGRMPYQLFDDIVLRYSHLIKFGIAINVYAHRSERTLTKFIDFTGSRIRKEECFSVPSRGQVVPLVRINISKHLLPCKSRFTGWKMMLPLTEAHDDFDEVDRHQDLIPTLGVVMAVNQKKQTAIVSTRPSRIRAATKNTTLYGLLANNVGVGKPKDPGVISARLLHGKKGSFFRGFLVKRLTNVDKQNVILKVFLGMDFLWPIWGHFEDAATNMLVRRLPNFSVIRIQLLEDEFHTKEGVRVCLASENDNENTELFQAGPHKASLRYKQLENFNYQTEFKDKCDSDEDDRQTRQKAFILDGTDDEGFDWNYDAQPNLTLLAQQVTAKNDRSSTCESSDEGDEKDNTRKTLSTKRTKADREEERRRKENQMQDQEKKRIRQALGQHVAEEDSPQTAEEFERKVMASPNDSSLWIRLIALHLKQLEVDKARQVSKRALKTIHGSEQDKLNIWLALLNLENLYGSQESLDDAFREAVKHNEPLKVHLHLAKIYASSHKPNQAREAFEVLLKKFKPYKEVWIEFGMWLFETGQLQEARQLLKKSFSSLSDKEQIDVIRRFASMEFSHGEHEVGKSLMDNLLLSYPKRIDLWNVYIDQLVKLQDFDSVRHKFNKLLTVKLPVRKMKSVFKKWLDFEQKQGTPMEVENVKRKIVDYIDLDDSHIRS
ncbi:uncharacterized protein LOC111254989 isoform X2 [Varroa destructor]|uniref:Suppressor of forked domain-containing protein n=1 Tax=Varroa destructor TaxID=109461 RepID=A0A7M7MJR0_VARDE|nr:uncharacterized protein LOC111254989 isoform X2 [Varroa destructor]